jgi:valyl-tRNA synthetase
MFGNHQYGEAGRQIYEFFWGDFADWYLEIAKLQMAQGAAGPADRAFYTASTLVRVLDACLRLLHPFTPFVTEELWGHLKAAAVEKGPACTTFDGGPWEDALIAARFPEPRGEEGWEEAKVGDFALIQEVVRAIRNLRTEKRVPPSRKLAAIIAAGEKTTLMEDQRAVIAHLAGLDTAALTIGPALDEKPRAAAAVTVLGVEIYLSMEGMVDTSAEKARLGKELDEVSSQIKRLEDLLGGSFAGRAPVNVVERERQKLATFQETAASLRQQLEAIE